MCNLDYEDSCEHKISIWPGWHLRLLLLLQTKSVNLKPALLHQQDSGYTWSKEPGPLSHYNPSGKRSHHLSKGPATQILHSAHSRYHSKPKGELASFFHLLMNLLYKVLVCRKLFLHTEKHESFINILQIKICVVTQDLAKKQYRTTSNMYFLGEQISNYWILWKHCKCYKWPYRTSEFAFKGCRLLIVNGPNLPSENLCKKRFCLLALHKPSPSSDLFIQPVTQPDIRGQTLIWWDWKLRSRPAVIIKDHQVLFVSGGLFPG